ncbi:MAG: tyrosine-type recombinase/integrase [Prochloraceae cyanobacterium]|nr:tyrosine-type recombinase/integrase [Prochloraceae cyanobacterium]
MTVAKNRPADWRRCRVDEFMGARSFSPNSQKAYRRELNRFLNWTDKPLGSVNSRLIVKYKEHLIESLAPSSVNRALSAVSSFFDWLVLAYPSTLESNPVTPVSQLKLSSPPARDLNLNTVEALLKAVGSRPIVTRARDAAILQVLLHGLRASEVAALNLGDYDGVRLYIRQGKDDSSGTVPLNKAGRTAINAYLQERRVAKERFSRLQPLFLSYNPIPNKPQRLGYQGIYYLIKDLESKTGLNEITPHRMRHTFATNLLLKGMDSLHARTLTRHKSESSFKRYAKRALSAAAERAFYQAIGETSPDTLEDVTDWS